MGTSSITTLPWNDCKLIYWAGTLIIFQQRAAEWIVIHTMGHCPPSSPTVNRGDLLNGFTRRAHWTSWGRDSRTGCLCSQCAPWQIYKKRGIAQLIGHSPSSPLLVHIYNMSFCVSTSTSADVHPDMQQLDGQRWKRQLHKLGHLQHCICSDSQAERPANDSWMNYKVLPGEPRLPPHHYFPTFKFSM